MGNFDTSANLKAIGEQVAEMQEHLHVGNIPSRNVSFLQSLCDYYNKNKYLSERQYKYFLDYLHSARQAARAAENTADSGVEKLQPRVIPVSTKNFMEYIENAAQRLKYVTIRFTTELSPSGKLWVSYSSGTVYFHDGGSLIARERKTFAHIGSGDRQLVFDYVSRDNLPLQAYINAIVKDLPAEAKINGLKYSNCCFCCRELTNSISIHHGYGPICASKFNLPWEGPRPSSEEMIASLGGDEG